MNMARLRAAMTELHTWAGVLTGALLFLVFFMGSISVFDRELDRWMLPATRIDTRPDQSYAIDRAFEQARPLLRGARDVYVRLPGPREPYISFWYRDAERRPHQYWFDPYSAAPLPAPGSLGASGFFYPLHYNLMLGRPGTWVVGVAAMTLLVLLVSGVIIHKKLFADFFTLRLDSSRQRGLLDLHNVSAVMLLPFHFAIALSGLIISTSLFMPAGVLALYPAPAAFIQDAFRDTRMARSGEYAPLASVEAMLRTAERHWGGGRAAHLEIRQYNDRNAVVKIERSPARQISVEGRALSFAGASGALLDQPRPPAAIATWRFIEGLHLLRFDYWPLLWAYFLMGIGGCVMIASGLLVWLEKRARRAAGSLGYRCARCVAVGGSVGLALASAALLAANRLLPDAVPQRAQWEIRIFCAVWLLAFVHAWWRPGLRGAGRQLQGLGALCLSLPALNALTTGDHLVATALRGQWSIAGADALFLGAGALSLLAARRLAGNRRAPAAASALETPC